MEAGTDSTKTGIFFLTPLFCLAEKCGAENYRTPIEVFLEFMLLSSIFLLHAFLRD